MQSVTKKMFKNDSRMFHISIVEGIQERLIGIHNQTLKRGNLILLFRTPCLLHSFGMNRNLYLSEISSAFEAKCNLQVFEPNSIVFCWKTSGWLAEVDHPDALQIRSHPLTTFSSKKEEEISFIKVKFASVLHFISITLLIFLFLVGSTFALAAEKQNSVKIQVGESKEVDLREPPRNLDISQSDVIDVQRLGISNRILVTALRSGTSSLVARFPDGRSKSWTFQVGSSHSLPTALATLSSVSLLRAARELQRRSGLEVTVDNGRIAFFGVAQNEAQIRGILEICLEHEECLPRYTFTDSAGKTLLDALYKHLSILGFKFITLEASLSGIIFTGHVSSEEQLQILMKIAQSVCPRASFRVEIERGGETLVQSQLSFYRISQKGLTALGMSTTTPSASLPDSALAKVSTSELSAKLRGGPILNLSLPELLLKAHSQKGVIQQIAQPSIIVASGSRGEILSGGELLFQSRGQNQKFFSQNYGLSVVLQPRVVSPKKIVQRIELKITHPQSDPTNNAISSFNSSHLNTEVNSQVNEVLLLTRISQKANSKATMKIPILGHLPILGEVFKSRELSDEDAELWITLKSDLLMPKPPTIETELNSTFAPTQPHWLD